MSSYLCPSSEYQGSIVIKEGNVVIMDDLAPGNYVASAGTRSLSMPVGSPQGGAFLREGNDDGVMYRNSAIGLANITDGSSTTLMVGERSSNLADAAWVGTAPVPHGVLCTRPANPTQECVFANILVLAHSGPKNVNRKPVWVDRPNYPAAGADSYWSRHSGGCNFLYCDGSVRFIKETIQPQVFGYLATRSGGETVSADQY
jgi:prepilin-type processing-associated H-X9-DG protein